MFSLLTFSRIEIGAENPVHSWLMSYIPEKKNNYYVIYLYKGT